MWWGCSLPCHWPPAVQWRRAMARFSLCLPRADTDASGGDAITKGFIRGKKCERDGAVVRDACSMHQPRLSAVSIYWFFPLSALLSMDLYPLYKNKQSPCLQYFIKVWWRGGKRKEKGWIEEVRGGGVILAAGKEKEREWEKGKADMHESLKQQPKSRKRATGDKGVGVRWSVPEALQKKSKDLNRRNG